MTTCVALLRGINVGGHRPLKMNELQDMFSEMGFKNISTYIQSGNIVFDASLQEEDKLAGEIKSQIRESFGYEVPVIVYSAADLKATLEQFPFDNKEGWKGYITFLAGQPSSEQRQRLEAQSSKVETFQVGNRAVYAHVDKQADQKPKFSNKFIQQQLNTEATNRNLRTVRKILELAELSG